MSVSRLIDEGTKANKSKRDRKRVRGTGCQRIDKGTRFCSITKRLSDFGVPINAVPRRGTRTRIGLGDTRSLSIASLRARSSCQQPDTVRFPLGRERHSLVEIAHCRDSPAESLEQGLPVPVLEPDARCLHDAQTYQDSHFSSRDIPGASRSELDADCRRFVALYTRHTFAFATRGPAGPCTPHVTPLCSRRTTTIDGLPLPFGAHRFTCPPYAPRKRPSPTRFRFLLPRRLCDPHCVPPSASSTGYADTRHRYPRV